MAERTVVGTTDRHRVFNEFESLNFVTETAGRTVAGKKKSWNKKKKKETERERENKRMREERTKRKQKALEK